MIVPALLTVVETLANDRSASIQVIAATHSPLVLASAEPLFDTTATACLPSTS
jgi:predicted ATPase